MLAAISEQEIYVTTIFFDAEKGSEEFEGHHFRECFCGMILDKIRILNLVCYEKNYPTICAADDLSIFQVSPRGVVCIESVQLYIILAPLSVDASEEVMVSVVVLKARI